jgi:hypothetical protein
LVSGGFDRSKRIEMDYIAFLQDAIREAHGCESTHIETVAVKERFQGKTVWEGDVEVFDVPEHPSADKLFAWGFHENDETPDMKAVTVLAVHPITTPQRAVQAYIANEVRKGQSYASEET